MQFISMPYMDSARPPAPVSNMNKLITRWQNMTWINVSHPPGLSRFIKFHYSMPPVWERDFVSSSHHSKKTATCLYEQSYVLLVFWGEVVSNCPTKPTYLPNNPTVVWFSAHLWVPLVDRQLSPNTSWARFLWQNIMFRDWQFTDCQGQLGTPFWYIWGWKSSPICEKPWHYRQQLVDNPFT